MTLRRRAVLAAPLVAAFGSARAQPAALAAPAGPSALQAPAGPIVLSVVGRIGVRNAGDAAAFDMPMLEALAQQTIATRTPWYAEARTFTGPLLREVLARAGATAGTTLRAVALNDYRVDIPFDDVRRHDVIVARLLDGRPMPVREKGPLFVMYPFDGKPELRTAVHYSRCIWQLRSVEVM